MTLIVEDGTGKADAESYDSVAGVTAYWALHGGDGEVTWTAATTAEQESALRYGTRYLDAEWEWPGTLAVYSPRQALAWPRVLAYDSEGALLASNEVPAAIKAALAELAVLHLASPLNATLDDPIDRVKLDVLEVEFGGTYAGSPSAYPEIDRILAPIAQPRGGSIVAVRG